MIDGIDRESRVAADDRGDEKSPDEQLRAAGVEVRLIQGKKMADEQYDAGFHNRNRAENVFKKDPACFTPFYSRVLWAPC